MPLRFRKRFTFLRSWRVWHARARTWAYLHSRGSPQGRFHSMGLFAEAGARLLSRSELAFRPLALRGVMLMRIRRAMHSAVGRSMKPCFLRNAEANLPMSRWIGCGRETLVPDGFRLETEVCSLPKLRRRLNLSIRSIRF